MLLPQFQYHEPATLTEACQIMAELKEKAKLLAGGTDLIVKMKKGLISPGSVVSLGRIPELTHVERSDGTLKLGACLKVAHLVRSEKVLSEFSALYQGAKCLGSPLVRNLATIGGNIVSARPAADLSPSLLAYDASAVLRSVSGKRQMLLHHLFLAPGKTVIAPEEILTEIMIARPPARSGAAYLKLGFRKALEISIVNVASFIALESQGERIQAARIVLGAVAPTPLRAISAEEFLVGEKPIDSLFAMAGEAAAKDSKPITDLRGSAEYRQAMVSVLTERTLKMAFEKAKAQRPGNPS